MGGRVSAPCVVMANLSQDKVIVADDVLICAPSSVQVAQQITKTQAHWLRTTERLQSMYGRTIVDAVKEVRLSQCLRQLQVWTWIVMSFGRQRWGWPWPLLQGVEAGWVCAPTNGHGGKVGDSLRGG